MARRHEEAAKADPLRRAARFHPPSEATRAEPMPAVEDGAVRPDVRPLPASPDVLSLVARARAFVLSHPENRIRGAELAEATRVSETTVRRALLAETGLPIRVFVLHLRLEMARAWLMSNRETRSQAEIASALGWRSGGAFARAYVRRFGETMTETRCRALRLEEQSRPPTCRRRPRHDRKNIHHGCGVSNLIQIR